MSTPLKIVFFGTHQFGCNMLKTLLADPSVEVGLVITQPDKPVGRKKVMTASPVKTLAEEEGLHVETPKSLKTYTLPGTFDIGITAQYGLLVPEHILNAPTHGILNVHTSLLPKYRGASPIQSALLNGETETGVTIMKMDKGLDTGDILVQAVVRIDPDDTYPILDKKLAEAASTILVRAMLDYVAGGITPKAQDDADATHCGLLSREDGKVDWAKNAQEIYNQYRGLTPWPGIWTSLGDKRLKLLRVSQSKKNISPGRIHFDEGNLYIGARNGSLQVHELQLEGKNIMNAQTFMQGYQQLDKQKLV